MNRHPLETTQHERTEFWENLRDERLDEYGKTLAGMTLWQPIDMFERRKCLRAIERFVIRATIIIKESRAIDEEIAAFHENEAEILPTPILAEVIPISSHVLSDQSESSLLDTIS